MPNASNHQFRTVQQGPAFEELPSDIHDFTDEAGPNPDFVEEDELLEEDLEAEEDELGQ
jgi:hypothetical protein